MNRELPQVLVVVADPTLAEVTRATLSSRFDAHLAATPDAALHAIVRGHYAAVIWDGAGWGAGGEGFLPAMRHVAPGVRVMDMGDHVSPHLATLGRLRRRADDWAWFTPGDELLDAMIASADDPVFVGPHVN